MKDFLARDWQRWSKALFPFSGSCHINTEQIWIKWTEKQREEFKDDIEVSCLMFGFIWVFFFKLDTTWCLKLIEGHTPFTVTDPAPFYTQTHGHRNRVSVKVTDTRRPRLLNCYWYIEATPHPLLQTNTETTPLSQWQIREGHASLSVTETPSVTDIHWSQTSVNETDIHKGHTYTVSDWLQNNPSWAVINAQRPPSLWQAMPPTQRLAHTYHASFTVTGIYRGHTSFNVTYRYSFIVPTQRPRLLYYYI